MVSENKERSISNLDLSDKEKRYIDIGVNGSFILLGLYLVMIDSTDIENIKRILGLLAFYIGVRFFPK